MDRSNDIQRVRRSIDSDIKLERFEADVKRRQQQFTNDDTISKKRAQFDKEVETKHSELAKRVRAEQTALFNKTLNDLRATYADKIKQERALSNEVLQKARKENDAYIQNEREKFDSMVKKARDLLVELENENLKLKTVTESEEVRANMNVEGEDMIHIPRRYFFSVIQHECQPNVVMRFKIHSVKEIYSDLQKYYDSREELAEFAIREPQTIEYWFLSQHMTTYFGYKGDAQLYYLNPAPGSEPSTALLKIDGQDDVDRMVEAHANERTKICHLYIVNGAGFYDEEGYAWQSDDDRRYEPDDDLPNQSDEELLPQVRADEKAEEDATTSHAMNKPAV